MPLTRTRILLILGALVVLALPVSASAAPSRKKSIWGPATTANGRSLFPTYRDLGAGIWQNRINWSAIAPTRPTRPRDPLDPAYQWPVELGPAIAEGRRF